MNKKKVLIIAEAGVNHNGSIIKAKKLIDLAKQAGADFIKFQIFTANTLVTKKAKKTKYQLKNYRGNSNTQYEMLKKLELSFDNIITLLKYAKKKNIKFLLSPFDEDNVIQIKKLKLKFIKIPSGEITNLPLLKKISMNNFRIFLSTGMSTIEEIKQALKFLKRYGTKMEDVTILHCNSEYPSPFEDVNLNVLKTFKKVFKLNVGYSDHTIGDQVSIAAVAMGAKVIEKHITLDTKLQGPDHSSSMPPSEFISYVKKIRDIETSLGTSIKKPSASEKKNIRLIRKSIYSSKFIKKGEKFDRSNLCLKRPNSGISPMQIDELYKRKAKRNYSPDSLIKNDELN